MAATAPHGARRHPGAAYETLDIEADGRLASVVRTSGAPRRCRPFTESYRIAGNWDRSKGSVASGRGGSHFFGVGKMHELRRLWNDKRGAAAVEYSLILALMFLALIGGVAALGAGIHGTWSGVAAHVAPNS